MTKYEQPGDVLDMIAPSGGVTSSQVVQIGEFVGVAMKAAAEGETFPMAVKGVFNNMPILSTDTPAQGAALYWDNGNSRFTTTASTHKLAAHAVEAKSSGPAIIKARLIGINLID